MPPRSPGHASGPARWRRLCARGFAARTLARPRCFVGWRTARTGLAAAVLLAVMLISLSWLGLALRETSAARSVAERQRIAAIATLTHDQIQVGGLTAQLEQASVIALAREQASAAAVASFKLRAQIAERMLARARRALARDRGKAGR